MLESNLRNILLILVLSLLLCVAGARVSAEEDKFKLIEQGFGKSLKQEEQEAVVSNSDSKSNSGKREIYTLEECLTAALKQNFDILAARERIEKQQGVSLVARSLLIPKLAASGGYQQIDPDKLPSFGGRTFGTDKGWQADIEVVQPVFTGGEGTAERRRAKLLEEASRLELESVVNSVVFEVKKAFYAVLLAHSKIKVWEQSVKLLEEELSSEKSRFEAGTVSNFNVLRAEVEFANAKTPLIKARNDLRLAIEDLSNVMGFSGRNPEKVRAPFKISGKLKFEDFVLNLPDALQAARERRPELRRLKILEMAQKEGVNIARAGYFPRFNLFAGYGWESTPFDESLSRVDQGWTVGAKANWNIFDGFATSGRVRAAKAERSLVRVERARAKLRVDTEVRKALSRVAEARELVSASFKVIEQAKESHRLAASRVKVGAGAQIELIDAQVALTKARSNKVEALYAFNTAKAALDKAVGILN